MTRTLLDFILGRDRIFSLEKKQKSYCCNVDLKTVSAGNRNFIRKELCMPIEGKHFLRASRGRILYKNHLKKLLLQTTSFTICFFQKSHTIFFGFKHIPAWIWDTFFIFKPKLWPKNKIFFSKNPIKFYSKTYSSCMIIYKRIKSTSHDFN